jgi:glutathione synthase/RimK-type ligase-like ATP-grasp enzyme
LAQKYLLEALGAPVVPSYAFYDRASVIKWIKETEFPKVFKLRRGAGSNNVLLVRDRRHARSLCNKAFSTGFVAMPHYLDDFSMKIRKVRWHSDIWEKILRGPQTLVNIWKIRSQFAREKGYMLFQDFIPNNTYDTRVTIIGNRAFGFIRGVRPNDFRASGSGLIDWHKENVDFQCVRAAFEVAKKIGAQSLAFDFVKDAEGHPLIAEISYTYLASAVYQCSGHWDEKLNWHEGHVWPQDAIMQDMLEKLSGR